MTRFVLNFTMVRPTNTQVLLKYTKFLLNFCYISLNYRFIVYLKKQQQQVSTWKIKTQKREQWKIRGNRKLRISPHQKAHTKITKKIIECVGILFCLVFTQ